MKKIITGLLLMAACHLSGYAQCDKKILLTGIKTEYLNADGSVERSQDEQTTIEYDKNNFTINTDNEEHRMAGTITSTECKWQTPFKDGKTVLKIELGQDDKKMHINITITAKDGKISFLATVDEEPAKRIRLVVDKFEEKN